MSAQPSKTNNSDIGKTKNALGIPSVAAKKTSSSQLKNFLLFGFLILCILAAVSFGLYQKKHFKQTEQEKERETPTRFFSSKALTLPPIAAIEPIEPPKTEPLPKEKEEKKEEPAKETPAVIVTPPTPLVQPSGHGFNGEPKEKELTLEEKRNLAPMMGEGIKDISSGEEKGLAQSFREEGYNSGSGGKLGSLLSAVSTPPVKAGMMPNRNLLLAKGTFIDCILETKLDTTVPGMTSCVLPKDIYSANGKVLLLEKGSKAIGEYKGAVENGLNRIFVLWTQIQTPKGVRINLDSPATDSLGGAGMAGDIDFHWWARFGNALLFTLVQDAFEFGMTKQTENNGGVNYYQNSEDGMKEIIREAMRQSGNIPPTLTKNQGERVGIFVARDVDFSSVYQLRPIQK